MTGQHKQSRTCGTFKGGEGTAPVALEAAIMAAAAVLAAAVLGGMRRDEAYAAKSKHFWERRPPSTAQRMCRPTSLWPSLRRRIASRFST